jgi:hypothetical protein
MSCQTARHFYIQAGGNDAPLQDFHQGQLSQALGNRAVAAARELQPQVAAPVATNDGVVDRPAFAWLMTLPHATHRGNAS